MGRLIPFLSMLRHYIEKALGDVLLLETSDNILLETGDNILVE